MSDREYLIFRLTSALRSGDEVSWEDIYDAARMCAEYEAARPSEVVLAMALAHMAWKFRGQDKSAGILALTESPTQG